MKPHARNRIALTVGVSAAIALIAAPASAASLTWKFQNAVFQDGGTLTGSFDYDAATNIYSNVNLLASGGQEANFNYQGGMCNGDYSPIRTCVTDGVTADSFKVAFFGQSLDDRDIFFRFLQPLTAAGGIIPLFTNQTFGGVGEYLQDINDGIHFRSFVSGEVVSGTAAAVPEPTTMAGLALAGAGVSYIRRRRELGSGSAPTK